MVRYRVPFLILATLVSNYLAPSRALAIWFYVEPGIGLGQLRGNGTFFSATAPANSSFAPGFSLTTALSLTGENIPVALHLGVLTRYSTGGTDTGYLGLLAAYPAVRIQMNQFFFSIGATPFVWRRESPDPGINSLQAVSGAISYLGEVGLLWPISPNFSLGGVFALQFVGSGGNFGPKPALDLGVLLRFYYGSPSSEDRTKGEFTGWRYPFGNEIRK